MILPVRTFQFLQNYLSWNSGDILQVEYDSSLDSPATDGGTIGYVVTLNGVGTAIVDPLPDPIEGIEVNDQVYFNSFCESTSLVEPLPYNRFFPYGITSVTPNSPSCSIWVCDLIQTITDTVPASAEDVADGQITVNATSSATIEYNIGEDFDYGAGQVSNTFTGLLAGTYRIYLRDSHNCGVNFLVTVGFDSTFTPKYRMEYDDLVGGVTRLDVAGRTYEGDVEEVCGSGSPFSLRLRGEGEQNKFLPVLRTEGVITFVTDTPEQFRDLFTFDPSEWRLYYYKNSSLKWIGKILPNQYQEDYKHEPYYVSFSADDGVSSLKDIPFIQDDNTHFRGEQSIIKLLSFCLKKTGIYLPFRIGVNLFSELMDQVAADDPFDQAYVDLSRYYLIEQDPSFFYVLEALLSSFNARIIQYDGYWNVMRVCELVDTYAYREFDYNGDYVTNGSRSHVLEVGVDTTDCYFCNANQNLEITPAYGKMRIKYDLGQKPNLFENGDFSLSSVYNTITGLYEFRINYEGFTIFQPYPLVISYQQVDIENVALLIAASDSTNIDGSAYVKTEFTGFKMGSADTITLNLVVKIPPPPYIPEGSIIGIPYIKVRFSLEYDIGVPTYLQSDGSWSVTPNIVTNYVTDFNKYVDISITAPQPGAAAADEGNQLILKLYHSYVFHRDYTDFTELRAVVTSGAGKVGLRAECEFDGTAVGYLAGTYIGYYELRNITDAEDEPNIIEPSDYNVTTNPRKWVLVKFAEVQNSQSYMSIDRIGLTMPSYDTIVRESPGQSRNAALLEKTVLHGFATEFFNTLPNRDRRVNIDALIAVNAIAFEQLYSAYLRDVDGNGYENWTRDGITESDSLHGIVLKEMVTQYKRSSIFLRGDIRTLTYPGMLPIFEVLGDKFLPMSLEYNDLTSIYSVEMIELASIFTEGEGTPYSSGFSIGYGQAFD